MAGRLLEPQTHARRADGGKKDHYCTADSKKRKVEPRMLDGLAEDAEVGENKRFPQGPVFGIADLYDKKLASQHGQSGENGAPQGGKAARPYYEPEARMNG